MLWVRLPRLGEPYVGKELSLWFEDGLGSGVVFWIDFAKAIRIVDMGIVCRVCDTLDVVFWQQS